MTYRLLHHVASGLHNWNPFLGKILLEVSMDGCGGSKGVKKAREFRIMGVEERNLKRRKTKFQFFASPRTPISSTPILSSYY